MRCQYWPALGPILEIFATFHILIMTILTPTWTHLGESSQFPRLSFDSHGKLTLIRTLTHFGDFSQSLRLSNDFHGILALTAIGPIFVILVNRCDFLIIFVRCQHWPALAPILAIFASFHNLLITILTPTWTNLSESSQFPRLSYDSHGKLTLVRTLTHFGDFSQSLRLSNDFHGI